MKKFYRFYFYIILCLFLTTGCMKQQSSQASLKASSSIVETLGCKDFRSLLFDSLYEYAETNQKNLETIELKSLISIELSNSVLQQKIENTLVVSSLKSELFSVIDLLMKEDKNRQNIIQKLIDFEMEDRSSLLQINKNTQISNHLKNITAFSTSLNLNCNQQDKFRSNPISSKALSTLRAGMNNVFSTAYQSCQALAVTALTASTPDVKGITRLAQNHPDGIGGRRLVSNLSAVQDTHPYIRVAGNSSTNTCFNVNQSPLIYDYGGEPSTINNSINFFKNAGSGTQVLGIDCSALISSAAAVAGLRYKPGLENKAIFIRQSSEKFISAKSSNFTCYKNISTGPAESLRVGDIAAVRGHVLMIDRVGSDPFGIKNLSNLSHCKLLDSNRFDFTVTQSSPSKNGIGINKYEAKDYLNESPKMKKLFTEFGQATCTAFFQNTNLKPTSTEWGIIRHIGTAECLAPKIKLVGQSCVSQCQM